MEKVKVPYIDSDLLYPDALCNAGFSEILWHP